MTKNMLYVGPCSLHEQIASVFYTIPCQNSAVSPMLGTMLPDCCFRVFIT